MMNILQEYLTVNIHILKIYNELNLILEVSISGHLMVIECVEKTTRIFVWGGLANNKKIAPVNSDYIPKNKIFKKF